MKMTSTLTAILFAVSLSAQATDKIIPLTVSLSAKMTVQGPSSWTATTTNIAAPTVYSMTSASLLSVIARDEFYDGHYGQGAFPTGAKLVFLADVTDESKSYFEVVDYYGVPLVAVSNLLTWSIDPVNVSYGIENLTNHLFTGTFKSWGVFRIDFDDTASTSPGTHYQFYFQGPALTTGYDSTISNGSYTEKWTLKVASGGGTGMDVGVVNTVPIVVTGSLSMLGSKVFSVQ